QFEVEGAAEALAQRQAPGAIDAAAEWRMDHQLHAAGLVEETFENDFPLGGQRTERGLARRQIVNDLGCRDGADTQLLREPSAGAGVEGLAAVRVLIEALFDFFS